MASSQPRQSLVTSAAQPAPRRAHRRHGRRGRRGRHAPYGLGIAWDSNWVGQYAIVSQDLQTLNINPNVAYKIPGLDLAIAAGVQIYRSSVELNRNIGLSTDGEQKVSAQLGGAGGGVGFTASAMYKPTKQISIGLNYRSGVKLSMDGRAHFEGEEGTPFASTFVDQDISTELNIPHTVSLGLGFTHEKLFVGLDAVYTTWSDYDRVELKFSRPCPDGSSTCEPGETNPPTTVILGDWQDVFAFRLGAQYSVNDDLDARVGLVYDMSPVPERTLAPSSPTTTASPSPLASATPSRTSSAPTSATSSSTRLSARSSTTPTCPASTPPPRTSSASTSATAIDVADLG